MTRCDVLGIGETMAVVAVDLVDAGVVARPALVAVGGAESNVARTVAALGLRGAWAGAVGVDPLGDLVVDSLAEAGVDTRLVLRDPSRPTGLYVKAVTQTGTRVQYHRAGSAASAVSSPSPEWLAARPRIVHVTGITPALSDGCAALVEAVVVDRVFGDAVVSFDVNHRPALWDEPAGDRLLRLARLADVVFVGRDEAAALWDAHDADAVRRLVPEPVELVVKDAAVEAVSYTASGRHAVPAHVVDVVDAVGAGDAFAAGWLAAMLRAEPAEVRLRLGHWIAARALAALGDTPDVPRYERARVAAVSRREEASRV